MVKSGREFEARFRVLKSNSHTFIMGWKMCMLTCLRTLTSGSPFLRTDSLLLLAGKRLLLSLDVAALLPSLLKPGTAWAEAEGSLDSPREALT